MSITHTIFALDSCFSNYPAKTAHFKTLRDKDDDATEQSVQAKLDAYLDRAARYRDDMIELEREKLEEEAKKHSGYTGDEESSNLFVQRKGAMLQAKFIVSNPPTADVADHLRKLIDKSSDPRGPTFSKVHGNMSGRGNSASKQRGSNTGLSNAKTLHQMQGNKEEDTTKSRRCHQKKRIAADSSEDDGLNNMMVEIDSSSDDDSVSAEMSVCSSSMPSSRRRTVSSSDNTGTTVLTQPEISEVRDEIYDMFTSDPPGDERMNALNALLDDIGNRDHEIELANNYLCKNGVDSKDRLECLLKLKHALATSVAVNPIPAPANDATRSPTEVDELRDQIYEEIMRGDPDEERRNDLVALLLAVKRQCREMLRVDKFLCSKDITIKPNARVDGLIKYQKARARPAAEM